MSSGQLHYFSPCQYSILIEFLSSWLEKEDVSYPSKSFVGTGFQEKEDFFPEEMFDRSL